MSATASTNNGAVGEEALLPTATSAHAPPTDKGESILCFVCSRCEYPICTSSDLLVAGLPGGVTEYAFQYNLDYMLDLDDPVVCYSCDEAVDTTLTVSPALLEVPLPPAARVLALESILESNKHSQEAEEKALARLRHEHGAPAAAARVANAAPLPGAQDPVGVEHDQRFAESIPEPPHPTQAAQEMAEAAPAPSPHTIPPIRRYGTSSEARIDLICVDPRVVGVGLQSCAKDRSGIGLRVPVDSSDEGEGGTTTATAQAPTLSLAPDPATNILDLERTNSLVRPTNHSVTTSGGGGGARGGEHPTNTRSPIQDVPELIREAAAQPPPSTRWETPGNFSVPEAFVTVTRRTASARGRWFNSYVCTQRLECPDCHFALGYLLERPGSPAGSPSQPAPSDHPANHIHYERSGAPEEQPSSPVDEEEQKGEEDRTATPPPVAAALELKRILQREWNLQAFQNRYHKAQTVQTFRDLFPEAEELQSMYTRLSALRTQAELYNNLLRKHKEQNDVQSALLHSQKQRMQTYEEKLITMRQIIDAQRTQLDMQTKQLKNQDDLMRSHRQQVSTQQQQIEVEQLLLTEQNKTIAAQREQIKLMRLRFQVEQQQEQQRRELATMHRQAADTEETEERERNELPSTTQHTPGKKPRSRCEDSNEDEDWEDDDEDGQNEAQTDANRHHGGDDTTTTTTVTTASGHSAPRSMACAEVPLSCPPHLRGIYARLRPEVTVVPPRMTADVSSASQASADVKANPPPSEASRNESQEPHVNEEEKDDGNAS